MKAYGGGGCIDPHFLDLGTSWRWAVSFTPRPLYPRERAPGTHCIGGWVDPRAGLDMAKWKFLTLPGIEPRPLSRPARSQSLYRLRYPGSMCSLNIYQYYIFYVIVHRTRRGIILFEIYSCNKSWFKLHRIKYRSRFTSFVRCSTHTVNLFYTMISKGKVKISLLQDMEDHRVARS
jgi:hypothetical protein